MLTIPGIQVREDFLLLKLGSTDVILGMKWLRILSDTRANWGALTIKLIVEGRKSVIQGDAGLSKAMVSLKAMVRIIKEMGGRILVELRSLEGIRMEGDITPLVHLLIQQFKEVFQPS